MFISYRTILHGSINLASLWTNRLMSINAGYLRMSSLLRTHYNNRYGNSRGISATFCMTKCRCSCASIWKYLYFSPNEFYLGIKDNLIVSNKCMSLIENVIYKFLHVKLTAHRLNYNHYRVVPDCSLFIIRLFGRKNTKKK